MAERVVDINCDMGEGLGSWRLGDTTDEALLEFATSANIATGFHAGDPNLMDGLVQAAGRRGIGIGAHPGFRDLHGFGRRPIAGAAEELVNDVLYQVGALREFTRRHGMTLQHVKPHGALYMHAAVDEAFSRALVAALQRVGPELLLYCMDVAVTCRIAEAMGQKVVRELYADRDYDRTGSIVFKRQMGRLDPQRIADKVVRACRDGRVETVEGDAIEIRFDSICFHSDTPGAFEIGKAVRAALAAEGVLVQPAAAFMQGR